MTPRDHARRAWHAVTARGRARAWAGARLRPATLVATRRHRRWQRIMRRRVVAVDGPRLLRACGALFGTELRQAPGELESLPESTRVPVPRQHGGLRKLSVAGCTVAPQFLVGQSEQMFGDGELLRKLRVRCPGPISAAKPWPCRA